MDLKQALRIAIPIMQRERKTLVVPAQYARFGKAMPRAVGAKKRLDEIDEAIEVLNGEINDQPDQDSQPKLFNDEQ